jgi:hypothetical protein
MARYFNLISSWAPENKMMWVCSVLYNGDTTVTSRHEFN